MNNFSASQLDGKCVCVCVCLCVCVCVVINKETGIKFKTKNQGIYFFFNKIFKLCIEFVTMLLSCFLHFRIFGSQACGILAPDQRLNPQPNPLTLEGEILTTRLPGKSLETVFSNILEEYNSNRSKGQQFRHPVLEGNQNEAEEFPSSYHLRTHGE